MIKSQDELNTCNDGKRKTDVLIATIEKCEKLEEKLKIATEALEFYALKKHYKDEDVYIISVFGDCDEVDGYVENGLKAREALKKIKE